MIKDQKGITLITLVLTVVLMLILVGVGVNLTYSRINDIMNNQLFTELAIVRQAVIEQYEMARTVNQIKVSPSKEKVLFWVGERINEFSDINLPDKNKIQISNDVEAFYGKISNYKPEYQEDYYYRLEPLELIEIGITDAKHSYIVNYSTGEIYNETKKISKKDELLYLPTIKYNNSENKTDTTSFNDWNEIE